MSKNKYAKKHQKLNKTQKYQKVHNEEGGYLVGDVYMFRLVNPDLTKTIFVNGVAIKPSKIHKPNAKAIYIEIPILEYGCDLTIKYRDASWTIKW